jgi:hypothetical protein
MGKDTSSAVVACSLQGDERPERSKRWERLTARAALEASETERGLRLTFRRAPAVEEELRQLASLERECCAFAAWSVSAASDRLVLEIDGDGEEAVVAVQAMFLEVRSSLAPATEERR